MNNHLHKRGLIFLSTAIALTLCANAPAVAQEILIDDIDPATSGLSEEGFAISADGASAIGRNGDQNILWTDAAGFEAFAVDAVIRGLSQDGSVMAGTVTGSNGRDSAIRWTEAGGAEVLPYLSGDGTGFIDSAVAYDISDDGSIIVGFSNAGEDFNFNTHAVRWTESGIESLGTLDTGSNTGIGSVAYGISGDGSTIVGGSGEPGKLGMTAFRYTDATGMVSLGRLNDGSNSEAYAASNNGAVIVGQAADGNSFNASRAFRWTDAGGLEALSASNPNFTASRANDVSADGSVIVGLLGTGETTGPRAFRWTESTDAVTVENWLRSSGAQIETDTTREAHGVSADGTIIVGETRNGQMFIARGDGSGGGDGGDGGDGTGTGLVVIDDLVQSLAGVSVANTATLNGLNILLNGAGSRPLDRRANPGGSIFWWTGDLGRADHGAQDGWFGVGEIGGGRDFDSIQINASFGGSHQEQNTAFGGQTDINTVYAKLEALALLHSGNKGDIWAVLTGTGAYGKADINRNYLANGGAVVSSSGSTNLTGYGVRGRLQWEKLIPNAAPYAELSWAQSCMDGYTESGGPFPASFNRQCASETLARYGVDATLPVTERFRVTGTLEGVHRVSGSASAASGQVSGISSFNFSATAEKDNWARAGIGFEADVGEASVVSVMVNGTTQSSAASGWLSASWRRKF